MKRLIIISIMTCFYAQNVKAQALKAFKIVDKNGIVYSFSTVLDSIEHADFVFFGELHNNSIAHWLTFELLKGLDSSRTNVNVGMEMFEQDNQLIIDEYFQGLINKKSFLKEVRLWDNYSTDYAPVLEYARVQNMRFVATNVPRRYANVVFKKGVAELDKLSDEAKKYIAPLPIPFDSTLSCYKELLEMMGGHGGEDRFNFPMAQALKDATMAYFIAQNWEEGDLFFHVNGSFHSKDKEGIIWYLKQYINPAISISNIEVIEVENINKVERSQLQSADFTILVPITMTKTY